MVLHTCMHVCMYVRKFLVYVYAYLPIRYPRYVSCVAIYRPICLHVVMQPSVRAYRMPKRIFLRLGSRDEALPASRYQEFRLLGTANS